MTALVWVLLAVLAVVVLVRWAMRDFDGPDDVHELIRKNRDAFRLREQERIRRRG